MNAYLRAAQKFPQIREQAAERLAHRPDHIEDHELPGSSKVEVVDVKTVRRAKDALGRFKADDPTTPDNEAWEELP